ncbi:MAG TPA: rhomboid family intramembrane serine protease [Polyangia bacterium]|jgi:membrane associated rhomboid family serine protease|nr:rhomboid family intramembrane serine protease [Polyangia bacterium]
MDNEGPSPPPPNGHDPAVVVVVIQETPDERRADDWSLALASAGIAHRVARRDGIWRIEVLAEEAPAATRTLAAYDEENPQRAARRPAAPSDTPGYAGAVLAVALLGFFFVTGSRDLASPWFRGGTADAEAILRGEWWRTVTALTLHADLGHVLSNAAAGLLVVGAVCKRVGVGTGSWFILLTGAAGNALTALLHRTHHLSVGASTAVFGALGLLGTLEWMERRRGVRRRSAWVAVGAVLALLGFLGTGQGADLGAHLFGLCSGLVLGLPASALVVHEPGRARRWAEGFFVLAALLAVGLCWHLAWMNAVLA